MLRLAAPSTTAAAADADYLRGSPAVRPGFPEWSEVEEAPSDQPPVPSVRPTVAQLMQQLQRLQVDVRRFSGQLNSQGTMGIFAPVTVIAYFLEMNGLRKSYIAQHARLAKAARKR